MPAPQLTPAIPDLLIDCLDVCPNGITIIDANDTIVYQNQAQTAMLSLNGQSLTGCHVDALLTWIYHHPSDIVDAPDLNLWLSEARNGIRSKPSEAFETQSPDGRSLLITKQLTAQDGVIYVCTDITEQTRLRKELERLHIELERMALIDELTGIANRRHIGRHLKRELARARRRRQPLAVAMLDLDEFKRINDRFGHSAGDRVLRHFVAVLSKQLRATDFIGRLGGEEFVVVMPDTEIDTAAKVLTRIGKTVSAQRLDQLAPGFGYTFSAGLVEAPFEGSYHEDWLLAQADRALYQAKAAGRNQIVTAQIEQDAGCAG